ncbi:hypothetical protein M3J09_011033 [Ascochyta lentis]
MNIQGSRLWAMLRSATEMVYLKAAIRFSNAANMRAARFTARHSGLLCRAAS